MQVLKTNEKNAGGQVDSRTGLRLVGGIAMEPKVVEAFLACVEESARGGKPSPIWTVDRVRPEPMRILAKALAPVPMVDPTELVPDVSRGGEGSAGESLEPELRMASAGFASG